MLTVRKYVEPKPPSGKAPVEKGSHCDTHPVEFHRCLHRFELTLAAV
jgi:hypothetical protein